MATLQSRSMGWQETWVKLWKGSILLQCLALFSFINSKHCCDNIRSHLTLLHFEQATNMFFPFHLILHLHSTHCVPTISPSFFHFYVLKVLPPKPWSHAIIIGEQTFCHLLVQTTSWKRAMPILCIWKWFHLYNCSIWPWNFLLIYLEFVVKHLFSSFRMVTTTRNLSMFWYLIGGIANCEPWMASYAYTKGYHGAWSFSQYEVPGKCWTTLGLSYAALSWIARGYFCHSNLWPQSHTITTLSLRLDSPFSYTYICIINE